MKHEEIKLKPIPGIRCMPHPGQRGGSTKLSSIVVTLWFTLFSMQQLVNTAIEV